MAETAAAPAPAPAATRSPQPPRALKREEVLMVAGGTLLLLDVAFFVLGRMYYADKLEGAMLAAGEGDGAAADAAWALCKGTFFWSFFAFSTIGVATTTAAVLWPRQVAHSLSTMFGGLYLVSAGMILFRSHMPALVGIFQAAIGVILLRLTWASWRHKDRAAWAFLLSLAGVMSVALLFGAPRIRAAMHVPRLWFVMLLPAVMAALAVGLYRARKDYA